MIIKPPDKILWYYYDEGGNLVSFELNGTSYYYVNNLQGDIIAITDNSGNKVVEYVYDSWGKLISTTGTLAETVGVKNPYRYRGYRYDTETCLYYLQSRYYDPEIGRFINADGYVDTGNTILSSNMFAYCENNSVNSVDSTGCAIETIIDVVSIGWSLADFISKPSWINFGYLVWDTAAAFIPFVPGSYTVKGGKIAVKVASKVSDLKHTKYLTTGTYKALKKLFKGKKGIEVHHIVEKRLLPAFKKLKDADVFLSIPLDNALHKKITQRWRKAIPYGTKYKNLKYSELKKAIEKVYYDMPELKKIALKWLKQKW